MKRTFNYTGRRRIPAERLAIRMLPGTEPSASVSFQATIDLSGFDLPPYGRVFVDPYVKSSSMRFSFGTVEHCGPPEDCQLTDIDVGARVLFRLLVVDDTRDVGKILASADRVSPVTDSRARRSLLPLEWDHLGEQVWRVNFDSERPVLVLNNKLYGSRDRLLNDPVFKGSIYPHAFRIIVQRLYGEEERPSDEDEWANDWRTFVRKLVGDVSELNCMTRTRTTRRSCKIPLKRWWKHSRIGRGISRNS
jgi:hypothetical protein